MGLKCFLGFHRPSFASIARKKQAYVALCEGCGRPLERAEGGRWQAAAPLESPQDLTATG